MRLPRPAAAAVRRHHRHLAAGLADAPFLEVPWDPPEWSPERRDFMLARPVDIDAAGDLVLSDAPGLGIELDEDALARTRVAGDVIRSNN